MDKDKKYYILKLDGKTYHSVLFVNKSRAERTLTGFMMANRNPEIENMTYEEASKVVSDPQYLTVNEQA